MVTFIALLRGINIGSHRRMKMSDLVSLLTELGYTGIQTYIQSGNLVFESGECDGSTISGAITGKIRERYGYVVPVIVLTSLELRHVVADNPLLDMPEKRVSVTFLGENPSQENILSLEELDPGPEQFTLHGKLVYHYSPEGYKKRKLGARFFEKVLNVSATTRGWRTVKRLHAMDNR